MSYESPLLKYILKYIRDRDDAKLEDLLMRVDVNCKLNAEWTALQYACRLGNHSAVRQLLRAKAEINLASPLGETPLLFACIDGHTNCAQLLIAACSRLPW